MKKRILAAILAVAMVTSVFVGVAVNAEGEFDNAEVVLTKSFEEQDATVEVGSIVDDPSGAAGKVWMITDSDDVQTAQVAELDASKTYTMVLRVAGGIAAFGLQQMDAVNVYYGQYNYDGPYSWICGIEYYYNEGNVEYLRNVGSTWDYYAIKFTGIPSFRFCVKNQDVDGLTDGHIYVDDLLILEGDYVDVCRAWINDGTKTNPYSLVYELPTPEPVVETPVVDETTATVTPRPTSTATTTATARPTPSPTSSNGGLVSGDYQYIVKKDKTVEITAYTGNKSILDIPRAMDGYKVTSIGQKAFANNDVLEMIVLPDTIKTIGNYAFESCRKLATVNLGSSIETIEDYAFFNCQSLSLIAIPESVKSIGNYAFGYESSYNLVFGFSILGYSGTEAEKYCNKNGITFNSLGESENDNDKESEKETTKKSIKFTKKSVKLKKGKKVTLKVKITGAKKATFSVDKKGKKVVKLSKKKAKSVVVTGKKKGKAVITAKVAGKKATCKVTVK